MFGGPCFGIAEDHMPWRGVRGGPAVSLAPPPPASAPRPGSPVWHTPRPGWPRPGRPGWKGGRHSGGRSGAGRRRVCFQMDRTGCWSSTPCTIEWGGILLRKKATTGPPRGSGSPWRLEKVFAAPPGVLRTFKQYPGAEHRGRFESKGGKGSIQRGHFSPSHI